MSDRTRPKERRGKYAPLGRWVAVNPQVLKQKRAQGREVERERETDPSITYTDTNNLQNSMTSPMNRRLRYPSGQSTVPSSITPPVGRSRHAWPTPIRRPPTGLSALGPAHLRCGGLTGGWRGGCVAFRRKTEICQWRRRSQGERLESLRGLAVIWPPIIPTWTSAVALTAHTHT